MRHLLALPFACIMLAACAAPPGPQVPSFALEPGTSVEAAPGVLLRFEEVEDSRCPPGVHCVWAGRLSCRFSLTRANAAPESFILEPGEAAHASSLLGGKRIALDEASLPAPAAPDAVANHRVTVQVLP
ncbi:hypothetical protein [Massilia sp.]|uniref:hypothetical protein n=1 Tax=Massilia sp. TaxID=1882437 RepID=UPI0028A0256D|nr:hypothetical protein [Massilia sp.]